MDSDTKTLTTILIGLGVMVVVIVGGVAAFTYFEQSQKSRLAVTVQSDSISADRTHDNAATASSAEQQRRMFQFNVYEGKRSNFNPDTAYEPGEVLIAEPPAGFEDKIREAGFGVLEHIRLGRLNMSLVRVSTPSGMSVEDAIKKLSIVLPGVTIDANQQYEASAGGSAIAGSNAREMAGWDTLSPTCGRGLVLGQIDSGIDMTHPALVGQHIEHQAFTKPGREPGPPDHGTAVAAMLVGKADWGGLLPGAKLYAANMFEINENGKIVGSSIGLLKAIDWMATKHVDAVNLSIAGNDNKVVRQAFELANKEGFMMVAAVGNWGRADKPAYPAAYDFVVAVTATKGSELIYSHANQGQYVDFAAPGVAIYTAQPGGGGKAQSGTSFATPYITAMAAILNNAGKTPTPNDLRKALSTATRDLGTPGRDDIFGYGYVNARPACK
ncbi:S8 family serine peptidase [Magnetovibrio blakemorei]|nr:S8 family serine peptidase [Magnetovibrio blakemorei]